MNWIQRILSLAAGLLLIDPSGITDIIGIALIALVFVWQIIEKKFGKDPEQLKAA
jgi:TRAP-type uncharacterized transport system fused permease subunit